MASNGTGGISAKELAFSDVERELKVTRRVLEAVPEDKFSWKPHEKSMTLLRMAHHVAQIPEWMVSTLGKDELDFATMPMPKPPATKAELLALFDGYVEQLRKTIAEFDMARMAGTWTIRQGAKVITTQPRLLCYRVWCMNHLVHHRGQLCLFLRLLNVAVPAVYFNSADYPEMVFE
jgi:uncharacterized damage-inducible protein DinB